ncbi:MAG: methylenetetrahydrofolate reductase, partial [Planktomarina sp.]|nr:methylenetetrahydrofolate reductase [Planktomarina sp.]
TLSLIPCIFLLQNWSKARSMAHTFGTSFALDLTEGLHLRHVQATQSLWRRHRPQRFATTLIQNGISQLHSLTINHATLVAAIYAAIENAPPKKIHTAGCLKSKMARDRIKPYQRKTYARCDLLH